MTHTSFPGFVTNLIIGRPVPREQITR